MRRRQFIYLVGSVAAAWPLAAFAQQAAPMRRIAILMNRAANDPEGKSRLAVFKQAMEQLGWSDGRNMRIEIRWGEDDIDLERKYAAELVALSPDLILAAGTLSVAALRRVNRTLPTVFRLSLIPSVPVSSTSLLGQAGTSPDSRSMNTVWAGNGWNS